MNIPSFDFVQARAVRRAVVPAGDIREDIAFQNDINGLLARFDGKNPPLTALDWIREPVTGGTQAPSSAGAAAVAAFRRTLRVIRGGGVARGVTNDITIDGNPQAVSANMGRRT